MESTANPIFAGTGNKYQREVDFIGSSGLDLVRHYSSSLPGWVHNFSMRVLANNTLADVVRPDGRGQRFTASPDGSWVGNGVTPERLFKLTPAVPTDPTWRYVNAEDGTEWYDALGLLVRVQMRGGRQYFFQRSQGLLTKVSDDFGRGLEFNYDADSRVKQVKAPDGTFVTYSYGADGKLSAVAYPDGASRQYLYENPTYPLALTGIIDERGVRSATWTYDSQGRAISSEHAGGAGRHILQYASDGSVQITDPLNMTRTQRFVAASTRVLFSGQSAPCAGCVGDAASKSINPGNGLVDQETDYLGVTTQFTHDSARKLPLSITQAAGRPEQREHTITWHPTWRLPALVSEPGRTLAYVYDEFGSMTSQTITDLATGQARTWTWTYAANRLPETMRDSKGRIWRYRHDNLANLDMLTDPMGRETRWTHDAGGRPLTRTEPGGLVTTYSYDQRGRLLSTNAGGEISNYAYLPTGQLASASLPDGYQLTYAYDPALRLIGVADNRGNSTSYTLDAAGNRVREEVRDAGGTIALATNRVINSLNRVTAVQGAAGQTTQIGYDSNGEPVSQTDPLNQTTRQTLDALGRPSATTFPDNTSAVQAWNPLDQLVGVTDPKGVATSYATNAFGEVTSETSPDIGTIRFERDASGAVIRTEDANGQITRIERDALGRITRIDYAADHQVFYSYDAAGRLSRIEDKSGTTSYERDALGRITAKTQDVNDVPGSPSRFRLQYSHAQGNLADISYPSGLRVTYQRTLGRITGIAVQEPTDNANRPKPVTSFLSNLTHTALGAPKAWSWFNGDTSSRSFDADGRMTANEFASYSFDAASRITAITQSLYVQGTGPERGTVYATPMTWLAGYDSRNRLVSFVREGAETRYSYDANSNRLTAVDKTTSDTDLDGEFDDTDLAKSASQVLHIEASSNRLLGFTQTTSTSNKGKTRSVVVSRVAYSLDANGALTSDGLRTFDYDASNRLAKVRIFKDGEAASVSYLTNALGQRVFKGEPLAEQTLPSEETLGADFVTWLKKQFGWLFVQPAASTSIGTGYIYGDGEIPSWAILGEYDNGSAEGKGRTEYIWLPTEDGSAIPVGMYRNGKLFAIHSDHLGTPRLMTNEAKEVVWQWPYSGFGANKPTGVLNATANSKQAITSSLAILKATHPTEMNLRFPGQYADEETGGFYNYFRNYAPGTGRYIQSDPIGLAGGINRNGYAAANPMSHSDPKGLALPLLAVPIAAACKAIATVVPRLIGLGLGLGLADRMFNESGSSGDSNVRENKGKGQKAEDEVAGDLEAAGRDVDRQVRKDTPFGPRIIDLEVKDSDGNVLGGIEVKSGGSRYRADQRSKDAWLGRNGYPVNVVRKP